MSSCLLCEIGSGHGVPQAASRSSSTEGHGTCHLCNVHACPRHGDRDPVYFECADCMAKRGVAIALGAAQPMVGGRANGPDATRLIAELRVVVSAGAVEQVGPAVSKARERAFDLSDMLIPQIVEAEEHQLWIALGLRPDADYPANSAGWGESEPAAGLPSPDNVRELAEWRVRAMAGIAREELEMTSPEVAYPALLALGIALGLAARGGRLGDRILFVPGGLTLDPLVAWLAEAYARRTAAD